MHDKKREFVNIDVFPFFFQNFLYLRKHVFKPFGKTVCMRMIRFYQKYLSRHTCLYYPTCSEYTLESINNNGVITGILLGAWRILRCNPFSKGGYDPAPECWFKKRWLL